MIQGIPQTFEEMQKRQKEIEENRNGMSWYLSFITPEDKNKEQRNIDKKSEEKNKQIIR